MNCDPAEAYVAIPAASLPALAATTPGPATARISQIRPLRDRISRTPPARTRVSEVIPPRARGRGESSSAAGSSSRVLTVSPGTAWRSLEQPREVQPPVPGHQGVEHVVGQDAPQRVAFVVHHQQ